MKVRELRKITRTDLKDLCIKNKWCTLYAKDEYIKFLKDVHALKNVSSDDIFDIARLIKQNSETDYGLESICFELVKISNSYFDIVYSVDL
jgi:hypothetical protein